VDLRMSFTASSAPRRPRWAITRGRDRLIPDRMKKNGASSCPPTRSSSTRSSTSSAFTTTAREGRRPLRRDRHLNINPRPFTWTKTADEILASLADYLTKLTPSQPLN
jgi:hypothetical protein